MTLANCRHFHIWLLHQEHRIRQMEREPHYRRLRETYRCYTKAVWVPGGRDGMVRRLTPSPWDETGGSSPAARYNPTTGQEQQHPLLPPNLRREHPA